MPKSLFRYCSERVRVVVVADPARAEHLDVAAIDVLQQRFEFHRGKLHLDAERFLPHRRDRDREPVVHFARRCSAARSAAASRSSSRPPRTACALRRCAPPSAAPRSRKTAACSCERPAAPSRRPAARRRAARAARAARDRSPSTARGAAAVLLERRAVEIEAVVVGVELRRDVQLGREILLDPVELAARHDVGHVQFAGAIARELGVLIGDLQILHRRRAASPHRSSSGDCARRACASPAPTPSARTRRSTPSRRAARTSSACCGKRRAMHRARARDARAAPADRAPAR